MAPKLVCPPLDALMTALEALEAAWEKTPEWHRPTKGLALRPAVEHVVTAHQRFRESGLEIAVREESR